MKNSYFIVVSDKLDYGIAIALTGYILANDLIHHTTVWDVIKHLTQLDYDDFIICDEITASEYDNSLIKVDFRYNAG